MSLKLAPSDYEIYIPIGEWIEGNIKEWLFEQRPLFKKISAPIDTVLNSLDSLFNFIPLCVGCKPIFPEESIGLNYIFSLLEGFKEFLLFAYVRVFVEILQCRAGT
jgi:ABC-type proline/glycine betaine transport system permease subunit